MKPTLVLLVLFTISLSLTDKEIIQHGLNGIFEKNQLKTPTTILQCIDNNSAHKIVTFAETMIHKAAKASVSDLMALPQLFKDFGASLDPALQQCLGGNSEVSALADIYGLTSQPSSYLEKKLVAHIALSYIAVHRWLENINNDWQAEKYYEVGLKVGGQGQVIFGSTHFGVAFPKEVVRKVNKPNQRGMDSEGL